jgi:hypothetical protein
MFGWHLCFDTPDVVVHIVCGRQLQRARQLSLSHVCGRAIFSRTVGELQRLHCRNIQSRWRQQLYAMFARQRLQWYSCLELRGLQHRLFCRDCWTDRLRASTCWLLRQYHQCNC